MKNNIFKIFLFLLLGVFWVLPGQSQAVSSLSDFSFQVQPKNVSDLATWTISFSLPEASQIGHILISLGGYRADLSQAQLSISGLPTGTAIIGKSNPTCASNCDDIRYYWPKPINVAKGQKITITLKNVKNPAALGQTGISFINLFSSQYPQTDLAFNANNYFVQLLSGDDQQNPDELIPETVTGEGQNSIQQVLINELFYQEGSQTTKLTEINDPAHVENFTLDLLDKVKVVFKEPIDLSNPDAVDYIANLADYATFDYLYFWDNYEFMSFFNVPLELTFYDLPYVWDPDILKDDQFILKPEELENFHSAIVDDKPQISFIIREFGSYRVVPHLELYIADNQEISQENNVANFSGRISDPKAIIKISLNGQDLEDLHPKIDAKTGEFSFPLELAEGTNLIQAEAESTYGPIAKETRIIHYQPTESQPAKTKEEISPIYYMIGLLFVLAIILIFAIRNLVKKK